jgi:hypothetical protein
MELIRLSAVQWPSAEKLMDVLVMPIGTVLDLNTRWSGVTQQQFQENPALIDASRQDFPVLAASDRLHIMQSPIAARELFFSFISPKTPLIGHAIDNDLTVMRIVHPTIVDTALIYPHRSGLPYRLGLKYLARIHLDRYIQANAEEGHDSLEDARATGDLVRAKIRDEFKLMKITGWTLDGDGFKLPDRYDEVKKRKAVNRFHEIPELGWWKPTNTQTGPEENPPPEISK